MNYHTEKIFTYLYSECDAGRVEKSKVLEMEARYVKVLEFPKLLNETIANDPGLFVGFMKEMYRGKRESDNAIIERTVAESAEETKYAEESRRRAEGAYEVISKFRTIPGIRPDGSIDSETLSDYYGKATELLKECDRFEIGSRKL